MVKEKRPASSPQIIPIKGDSMTADSDIFDASAFIYDLLYEDKDSSLEALWIHESLRKHGLPHEGALLELGAGTGRHARHFADVGHMVTGIDPSKEMLARATAHPRVQLLEGDGRRVRLGREFDAVLALFHVLSYQTTVSDVRDFFRTAAIHTRPGGLFAFDIWYSPAVHHLTPTARMIERENEAMAVKRRAEPEEDTQNSRVDVHYRYEVHEKGSGKRYQFEELHSMRHFSFTEIVLLAFDAGFEILQAQEFLSGAAPSRDTWGVWFVLRRT